LKPELHAENEREIGRVLGWGAKLDSSSSKQQQAASSKQQQTAAAASSSKQGCGVCGQKSQNFTKGPALSSKIVFEPCFGIKNETKVTCHKSPATKRHRHNPSNPTTTPPATQPATARARARSCAAAFDEQPVA